MHTLHGVYPLLIADLDAVNVDGSAPNILAIVGVVLLTGRCDDDGVLLPPFQLFVTLKPVVVAVIIAFFVSVVVSLAPRQKSQGEDARGQKYVLLFHMSLRVLVLHPKDGSSSCNAPLIPAWCAAYNQAERSDTMKDIKENEVKQEAVVLFQTLTSDQRINCLEHLRVLVGTQAHEPAAQGSTDQKAP